MFMLINNGAVEMQASPPGLLAVPVVSSGYRVGG